MSKQERAGWKTKKATLAFLFIFIIVFLADTLTSGKPFDKGYLYNGDNFGVLTEYGRQLHVTEMGAEVWRLLTCIFLHAGIPHLLLNMIPHYLAGSMLEKRIGSGRFVAIYLIFGIFASSVEMLFAYGAVGASGAIYGIVGCLLVSGYFHIKEKHAPIKLAVLILYLILPNLSGSTAIAAHAAGFIVGACYGLYLRKNGNTTD